MALYKIGDEVRVTGTRFGGHLIGTEGTITALCIVYGEQCYIINNSFYNWEGELTLLKYNKETNKIMDIKQKFSMLLMSEPNKSFRKAGITGSDYNLTTEGRDIFLQWLLSKNGDAFKTEVVDELLKDCKKTCD
jgi:hypothetical protein